MAPGQAIRYVAATKVTLSALYINCHVKPNARRGSTIISIHDDVVELAVSAQAKEGEANKAVIGLLATILKVPKSDVEVVRGMKSREKTVKVASTKLTTDHAKGKSIGQDADAAATIIGRVKELLESEVNGP